MSVILNKWIEKIRKKKAPETASAYESNPADNWLPVSPDKKINRFTKATRSTMIRTLRGVRR